METRWKPVVATDGVFRLTKLPNRPDFLGRCEPVANRGERRRSLAMQKVVGSSPIIRFAKDLHPHVSCIWRLADHVARLSYGLSLRPLPDGRSMRSGLMRTATTDEQTRRWFRRYWTLGVGSGAHVLVHGGKS
jgi:hypothetical protein